MADAVIGQDRRLVDAACALGLAELVGELRAARAEAATYDRRHRSRNVAAENDPPP